MAIGKPFKKGEGGRPKGVPNKATKQVKDVWAFVFSELQEDPKNNLMAWAKENPTEFYKQATKLLPVQMQHSGELIVAWEEQRNYESYEETNQST